MNDQLPSQDLKPGSLFKPQLPPFFPQHVCMLSCFSCVQLCAGKNTREAAKTSSRVSSQLGDRTHVSCSSCIAGRFFTAEPPRKPPFPSTHPHTLRGCSGTKSQPLLPPSLTQTVPPTQTPPILCARGLNGAQWGSGWPPTSSWSCTENRTCQKTPAQHELTTPGWGLPPYLSEANQHCCH